MQTHGSDKLRTMGRATGLPPFTNSATGGAGKLGAQARGSSLKLSQEAGQLTSSPLSWGGVGLFIQLCARDYISQLNQGGQPCLESGVVRGTKHSQANLISLAPISSVNFDPALAILSQLPRPIEKRQARDLIYQIIMVGLIRKQGWNKEKKERLALC